MSSRCLQTRNEIRQYLVAHQPPESPARISDDESLLESGVIDSVAIMDLIAYLEGAFGIAVGEDDMTPENFDSVNAIAAYVERKRLSASCTASPSVSAT